MAYGWLLSPVVQIVDRNGTPVVGGKVYVYDADTSILSTIYGDDEGTEISNPVLTDTLGNFTIFADSDKVYDIKVFDQNDMLLFTKLHLVANIGGSGSGSGSVQAGEGIVIRTAGDISIISVDFTEIAPLSALDSKQDVLIPGNNITITNTNIISAKDWASDISNASAYGFSAATAWVNEQDYATTGDLYSVSSNLSGAINYVSANAGKEYSGVSPIVVNNTTNQISADCEDITFGTGLQYSAGVLSVTGGGSEFPASANDAITAYQTYSGDYLTDSGAFYPMTGNPSGFMDSLFIAVYGQTPFSDVRNAVNSNRIVYCKVSPTGATRMAFLAYSGSNNYEFQYYRSLTGHNMTTQGDEVYVYTVANSGWASAKRNTFTQISAGPGLSSNFTNGANAKYVFSVTGAASPFPMVNSDGTLSADMTGEGITLKSQYISTELSNSSVNYYQAPSTNLSSTWYNILNLASNPTSGITVSSYSFSPFQPSVSMQLSAIDNLQQITFIAPWGGDYLNYSASFMSGNTPAYTLKVESGCCIDVVKARNGNNINSWYKKCWSEDVGKYLMEIF